MQDCATNWMRFETEAALALEAAFDGGRITSDGGLVWLSKMDSEMGLCEAISECVEEWRRRKGRHSLVSLVKQRVFQIACGYEDQNDSDTLREDPLLKMVCGSLPESGGDLASQPTISRMENAATIRSCHRIAQVLFEIYLTQREKGVAPERVLLDFDSTADPVHGEQEGSYYHGYYQQHIYHPLLVFDGQSGHLITALLRAGNTHASNSSVAVLKRIVCGLRERWPGVAIEIRADAGFAVPALYDYCEHEGISYTIALITNSRLKEMAGELLEEATQGHERTAQKARLFGEDLYEEASWEHARRVIYKAEAMEQGTTRRFVVSTRRDAPKELYKFYARRGEVGQLLSYPPLDELNLYVNLVVRLVWVTGAALELPPFNEDGLLPPEDYEMSLEDLKGSMLVEGPEEGYPNWDSGWRLKLVENLEVMVGQLLRAGITEIFVDGSFVEDKDHPIDIDGYFECDVVEFATGNLQRELNGLDPHKVWTWDPASRRPYRNQTKRQLPMWHRYRVELYPHYQGLLSAIRDQFGNDLPLPSAFRLSRREYKPKGIVKIVEEGGESA